MSDSINSIVLQALQEALLLSSKKVGSHPHVRNPEYAHRRTRTAAHADIQKDSPGVWKWRKSNAQTVAGKKYETLKNRFRTTLRKYVLGYLAGRVEWRVMEKECRKAFEETYAEAYMLGLRASGLGALDAQSKTKTAGPAMDPHDAQWIKTALKDERQYWNGFLDDVKTGNFRRFSPEDRISMYCDTLDHAYDVARVVGHPKHSVIYWKMNPEKEHCPICKFLNDNSPYTRDTLPGVPRDGHTCLGITRCGCELRIKTNVTDIQWAAIRRSKRRVDLLRKIAELRKGRPSGRRRRKRP